MTMSYLAEYYYQHHMAVLWYIACHLYGICFHLLLGTVKSTALLLFSLALSSAMVSLSRSYFTFPFPCQHMSPVSHGFRLYTGHVIPQWFIHMVVRYYFEEQCLALSAVQNAHRFASINCCHIKIRA